MKDIQHQDYTVQPFSRKRQLVTDAGWMARRKPMIHGSIEVDVTESRRRLREHRQRTGEKLSFRE